MTDKVQWWVLLGPDGEVRAQICIADDRTPSESGDNPEGLEQVRATRRGEHHERFDAARRRWVGDARRRRRHDARHRNQHEGREAYIYRVLTTLFPGLTITPEQRDALFPTLDD